MEKCGYVLGERIFVNIILLLCVYLSVTVQQKLPLKTVASLRQKYVSLDAKNGVLWEPQLSTVSPFLICHGNSACWYGHELRRVFMS